MAAQGGDVGLELTAGGLDPAEQVACAIARKIPRGVVQPLALPHEHSALGQGPLQGGQQGVVPVEDSQPVPLQVGEDLALGLKDVLPAAQVLNVGVADVGDEGHIRLHQPGQVVDFPGVVHAQLHHTHLMLRLQPEQGEGHADVVVEIPLRFVDAEPCPQHRRRHILGGGLPHRAGDGDEGDGEELFVVPGQLPQGALGGAHLDVKLAGQIALPLPGGEAARRPRLQRGIDEGVAVEPLPLQGDEQAAGGDIPAVGAHLDGLGVQIVKVPQQGAVHRLQQLSQCQCLHNDGAPLLNLSLLIMFRPFSP